MAGKLALVTGAARGIGLEIGRRLGRDGCRVILVDVLADALHAAADGLRADGLDTRALVLDLADLDQVAQVTDMLGPDAEAVSVLVNNAGISLKRDGRKVMFEDMRLDEWERTVRVNLSAPFLLCQAFMRPMRARRWGRVVNVSSKAGRTPSGVPSVDYVATKTGLLGLTRGIAKEVAVDGVTVNSVAPGRIETPMTASWDEATLTRIMAGVPVNRFGRPDEIAALVSFLAGEEAGFITGAVFDINGGALMI